MKDNKDFKEFFDSNDKDINATNDVNNEAEKDKNNSNKKNLNLYHQFRKKNNNADINKNN